MSDLPWKRPESIPFPNVWKRFSGKKPLNNGKIPKFRIQDVTEDLEDAVIEHMVTHFLRDSPLARCVKVSEDAESISNFVASYKESFKQNITLVAVLDDTEKNEKPVVVGAHILTVQMRNENASDSSKYQGKSFRKLIAGMKGISDLVNVYEKYDVNKIVTDKGLSVARELRGQGVALELLKAKTDLEIAIGVNVAPMICSALQSQILAEKLGYELLYDIPYNDYVVDGEIVFNVTDVPSIKYYVQHV